MPYRHYKRHGTGSIGNRSPELERSLLASSSYRNLKVLTSNGRADEAKDGGDKTDEAHVVRGGCGGCGFGAVDWNRQSELLCGLA